jgi:hypothetical protein
MTPGVVIRIRAQWCHWYRNAGTATVGVVELLSPNDTMARVRFEGGERSFVMVDHLEPVTELRPDGSNGSGQLGTPVHDQAITLV